MTSFATGLATPSVTDERTDTWRRLIYKDMIDSAGVRWRRSGVLRSIVCLLYFLMVDSKFGDKWVNT